MQINTPNTQPKGGVAVGCTCLCALHLTTSQLHSHLLVKTHMPNKIFNLCEPLKNEKN